MFHCGGKVGRCQQTCVGVQFVKCHLPAEKPTPRVKLRLQAFTLHALKTHNESSRQSGQSAESGKSGQSGHYDNLSESGKHHPDTTAGVNTNNAIKKHSDQKG